MCSASTGDGKFNVQVTWTDADKLIVRMMHDYPLEPGQMLLLGPRSVAVLTGDGEFKGRLPDKYIYSKEEWTCKTPRRSKRT